MSLSNKERCDKYRRTPKGKEARARAERACRQREPQKAYARTCVRNALRTGKLIRQPCWCGVKAEAHHFDYSKPLAVIWLCDSHHRQVEQSMRNVTSQL